MIKDVINQFIWDMYSEAKGGYDDSVKVHVNGVIKVELDVDVNDGDDDDDVVKGDLSRLL